MVSKYQQEGPLPECKAASFVGVICVIVVVVMGGKQCKMLLH